MLTMKIPYSYIKPRCQISWPDIEYGLRHQFIDGHVAIDLATEELAAVNETDSDIVALAGTALDEHILEIVERLAARNQIRASPQLSDKWLCIVLSWLYDHRDSVRDPLGVVEEVYAEFGYPRQIAGLIRY